MYKRARGSSIITRYIHIHVSSLYVGILAQAVVDALWGRCGSRRAATGSLLPGVPEGLLDLHVQIVEMLLDSRTLSAS